MGGAYAPRGQRLAHGDRFGLEIARAGQRRLERLEPVKLGLRRETWMVGDIVGFARKTIKGENRRPELRCDKARGDGEILIPLRLAWLCGARCHLYSLFAPLTAWIR